MKLPKLSKDKYRNRKLISKVILILFIVGYILITGHNQYKNVSEHNSFKLKDISQDSMLYDHNNRLRILESNKDTVYINGKFKSNNSRTD